jgi:ATP-binding cassette subfamily B protein
VEKIRYLLPLARPYRRRYLLGVLLAPLSTALALALPALTGKAVNLLQGIAGRPERSLDPILAVAGLILVCALGRGILLFAVRMLIIGASRDFEFDLRNRLFEHLLSLDARFFAGARTGDIMSRLTSDVDAVRTLFGPVVMYSANALFTLILAVPFMLFLDPLLTVLVLAPLSLLTLAVRRIGPLVHQASRRSQETFAELSSAAQENFAGVRVVKAFAREEMEIGRFREISGRYLERSMETERLSNWMGPIVGSLGEVAVILLLLAGGMMILWGRFSLGEFIEFAGYQALLIWPMISVGWVMNQVHRGTASAVRLKEILSARSEVADRDGAATEAAEASAGGRPAAPGVLGSAGALELEVRGLTFGYGSRQVLRGVSLIVPRGSTVAVIGRTGCGKSTLLGLIPRLWRVPEGTIFIDGRDVNSIPLAELRAAIGFVPQESFLFSRTILENVAFSADGERSVEVEDRARHFAAVARLDKDVDQFPRGYGELVGERGVTLSGGQKQRAAIARALLADPRLLILDDPLSAVDTHTEEEILANLRVASRGRTTLVASHRVSAIRDADHIYVLDEGQVVEHGTHRDLLSRDGRYAELYRRQLIADELEGL